MTVENRIRKMVEKELPRVWYNYVRKMMLRPELLEFERVLAQAKAIGVEDTFKTLLRAEQYRARSMPGRALSLQEILQVAGAIHESP